MLCNEIGPSDSEMQQPAMTTLVRIHRKGQMTLPSRLRSAIGIDEGDLVEASVQRGKIVLTPKTVINRSKFPAADDEYTPAQRRVVNAAVAAGLADFKAGRFRGPSSSVGEVVASIEKGHEQRPTSRKSKPRAR